MAVPRHSFPLALCLLFGAAAFAKKKPANINTAKSEELRQVSDFGPATAEKIVKMRKSYGGFKSVDDLLAIRGLGPKRLEKMLKYMTVGKPAAAKPTTPSVKSTPPAEKPSDKP